MTRLALHNKIILSFVVVLLLFSLNPQHAESAYIRGDMKNYCVVPPFVSQSVPPLVMLLMSKDQQMYFKAFTDTQDLDGDGVPDVTYKDSIRYYGYFDPDKCYSYPAGGPFTPTNWVDGYVAPPGDSTNHYCTAATGKWSGNFLNWATMSRIDVLRRVVYGGKRSVENNNNTVLGAEITPDDAHAWAKIYTGTNIASLTPSSGASQTAITICKAMTASSDTYGKFAYYWGDKTLGPASPSNTGGSYYPDAASTDAGTSGGQCKTKYNTGAALPAAAGTYEVKVQVCQFTSTDTSLLESNCMQYGLDSNPSYRPSGLMQKYGTNRHGSTNTADWENQMYFGLITGSYDGNKSGGVLRSNIADINSEVGSTDGKNNMASKLIKTLDNLKPMGYNFAGKNWTPGGSVGACGLNAGFNQGECPDWGNPIGEMYYEALRYFMGKAAPRTEYAKGDAGNNSLKNLSVPNAWDNPYALAGRGSCQKPFILILSDTYPSFDSDQLPGSNWTGIADDTGNSLNVQTLLNDSNSHMNSLELTIPGVTSVFAGEAGGTANSECTSKATTNLSNVRGLCPEEPAKEGSYSMAGLAWWAHTQGFINPSTGTNKLKLTTFSVATPTAMPNIEFQFGSNTVQMLPVFKDRTSTSKGQLASFSILTTATSAGGTCPSGSTNCVPCPALDTACTSEQTNGYQYGYEIMYDDSSAGNDYDLDIKYRIYVKTDTGANTMTIKTKGVYASAGHSDAAGYIITGVAGTNGPGEYLEITCGGDAGGTDCDRYCNDSFTATTIGGTSYNICNGTDSTKKYTRNYANVNVRVCTAATWVNCTVNADCSSVIAGDTCAAASTQTMADSEIVRVFNVSGSHADILENPLYYASKYGGFLDTGANHYPDADSKWKDPSRGLPNTYFFASNPSLLEDQLEKAFNAILDRASSGTAASVLASGEGNGANLLQAVFFPKRSFFGDTEAQWTGTLQNLWYYIDPKTTNSTIREDTNSDKTLQIDSDKILNFYFDGSHTTAKLYSDTNGDGLKDNPSTPDATVELDDIKYLWDGGRELFKTTAANRRIFFAPSTNTATTFNSANCTNRFISTTTDLDSCGSNLATLKPLLNTNADDAVVAEQDGYATKVIDYIRGTDQTATGSMPVFRKRKVSIDLSVPKNNNDNDAGEVAEWKLGDIVNSTPKILSWTPLNTYHKTYLDTTYDDFLQTTTVQNRGMVFAGANDGMLHAFKLGKFQFVNDGTMTKARLLNPDTGATCSDSDTNNATYAKCGREMWSFIPRNAMPYLKYFKHKDYCHLYYIDGTPFLFDASIEAPGLPAAGNYWDQTRTVNSWRTILIGSMRLGGACNNSATDACTAVTDNCVQTPNSTTPNSGLSSYFALDVTDPKTPIFLWEFSDPALGLSTTGPAIVKIKARTSDGSVSTANDAADGRWFVVFASGSTGAIDTTNHQFTGHSNQNLKLFVLDLKTGLQATTAPIDTGIPYAFGSSLYNAAADYDIDYQDDAVYIGYTMSEAASPNASTKWTAGGVLRLITREDLTGNSPGTVTGACGATSTTLNPNCWLVSKVIEGSSAANIGPVTSAISHIAHYPTNSSSPDKAWLYFGTGRYFFKTASTVDDGNSARSRFLFGVQDPCLSKIKSITTISSPVCSDAGTVCAGTGDLVDSGDLSCLDDQTASPSATLPAGKFGWYIGLDSPAVGSGYYERLITDPIVTPNGMAFFTTFAPITDICGFGGNSYLWAVRYDTGGAIGSALKGKALLQVSTGEIKEINLSDALVEKENRRTPGMPGVPPGGQGLTLVIPPKAVDRILHIRKK